MEPTIKCTTCGTDIPLTKTLAQPFIEAERAKLEGKARERAEVIQKREAQLEEQRSLLAERERNLSEAVSQREFTHDASYCDFRVRSSCAGKIVS